MKSLHTQYIIDFSYTAGVLLGYLINPIVGWVLLGMAFNASLAPLFGKKDNPEFWDILYLMTWSENPKQIRRVFYITHGLHWIGFFGYLYFNSMYTIGLAAIIAVQFWYYKEFNEVYKSGKYANLDVTVIAAKKARKREAVADLEENFNDN